MNASSIFQKLKKAYLNNNEWNEKYNYVNQIILADYIENENVTRKQAAKLIHEFLVKIIGEADEFDWTPAQILKDLFDCNICARHIAQLYVKGVMDPKEEYIFSGDDELTEHELRAIIERIFDKSKRRSNRQNSGKYDEIKIAKFGDINEDYIVIDVRTKYEHENDKRITEINIPLATIMNNPNILEKYRNKQIAFWCEGGYKSEMAVKIAIEHGFKNTCMIKT